MKISAKIVIILIKLIIALFLTAIMFSCNLPSRKDNLEIIISKDIDLIPYYDNGYGYINSETFEIVIPGQYRYVNPFTGDFAVVKNKNGRLIIINRNNKKVLDKLDNTELYDTRKFYEDFYSVELYDTGVNGMVFALIGNITGWSGLLYRSDFSLFSHMVYEPSGINYSLYNLTTKKLIKDFRVSDYSSHDSEKPVIRFFDRYMTYELEECLRIYNKDVYEINNEAFDGCTSLTSVTFKGTIPPIRGFSHITAFPNYLRSEFYAADEDNGTPGTYTRTKGGLTWTRQ